MTSIFIIVVKSPNQLTWGWERDIHTWAKCKLASFPGSSVWAEKNDKKKNSVYQALFPPTPYESLGTRLSANIPNSFLA